MEGADVSEGGVLQGELEVEAEATAAQPLEIERKFLVDALPDSDDSVSRKDVVQGYLAIENSGIVVRLRRMDNRCFQTVKGAGHMVRMEREIEMTPEQFGELWPATNGRRVEKTRYEMPFNGLTIELDVYRGWLQGLYTGLWRRFRNGARAGEVVYVLDGRPAHGFSVDSGSSGHGMWRRRQGSRGS